MTTNQVSDVIKKFFEDFERGSNTSVGFQFVTLPMAEAKGLLAGTVSPDELRGLDCSNPWAVPFRRLRGPEDPRYFCTLIGSPTPCVTVFPSRGGLRHTVVFLPGALRSRTRTRFSFQSTETSVPREALAPDVLGAHQQAV